MASLHLQDLSPAGFGQPQSGLSDTVVVPYRPIPYPRVLGALEGELTEALAWGLGMARAYIVEETITRAAAT